MAQYLAYILCAFWMGALLYIMLTGVGMPKQDPPERKPWK